MKTIHRCEWSTVSEMDQKYHDTEWGVPSYDDRYLFEMIILEGKQAGLSWTTILHKRETLREAFDHFDPSILITYDEKKIEQLLLNPGIIRHKLKVKAVISNAQAYFNICEQYGSLSDYLWSFVDHTPIDNEWEDISQVPATSLISDVLSKDLKKHGFKFVGSTTMYAFMQAVGMVNDHIVDCDFRVKKQ